VAAAAAAPTVTVKMLYTAQAAVVAVAVKIAQARMFQLTVEMEAAAWLLFVGTHLQPQQAMQHRF
jgi:hypothetical protein